ncbi:MAG: hypothetical protein QM784_29050 [Polyangiaceae bacterium]
MQQRLASTGIGISLAVMTKTATATCVAPAAKVGIVAALSARFAELPLLWQMGLVTATTAAVATGPLMVMSEVPAARNHEVTQVARQASPRTANAHAPTLAIVNHGNDAAPVDDSPSVAASLSPVDAGARTRVPERRVELTAPTEDAQEQRSLAEETRLVDRALAFIRAGNLDAATRELDEHDQRFPDGRLKRERRRAREKLEEARRNGNTSVFDSN